MVRTANVRGKSSVLCLMAQQVKYTPELSTMSKTHFAYPPCDNSRDCRFIANSFVRPCLFWRSSCREGLPTSSLAGLVSTPNPVRRGLSMESALQNLHMHNVLVVHDHWFACLLELVKAWRAARIPHTTLAQLFVFMTLFSSRDVLRPCRRLRPDQLP